MHRADPNRRECLCEETSKAEYWPRRLKLDYRAVARHNGTTRRAERARVAALSERVRAAVAGAIPVAPATFTGPNVPVNDDYIYLLMCIDLGGGRVSTSAWFIESL